MAHSPIQWTTSQADKCREIVATKKEQCTNTLRRVVTFLCFFCLWPWRWCCQQCRSLLQLLMNEDYHTLVSQTIIYSKERLMYSKDRTGDWVCFSASSPEY